MLQGISCIIQYSCDLGYELVGHAQQECLETEYGQRVVRCEHKCCCMVKLLLNRLHAYFYHSDRLQ